MNDDHHDAEPLAQMTAGDPAAADPQASGSDRHLSVGVVIPLYNKRHTINRALASVFAQQLPADAVIVIDDGSSDGSADAIDPDFLSRIDLHRVPNGGPGAARNTGALRCRTDLLAFLDADDAWMPDFLAEAVRVLTARPECGAYVAAYDVGPNTHKREELLVAIPRTGAYRPGFRRDPRALKSYIDAMHSSSTVVRRSLFERFGGFYGRDRCLFGEDSWFWIQVAFAGPVWFDRTKRSHFHVEDSALGDAQAGRHPRRPALLHPELLRAACAQGLERSLDRLLAYYRLLETESLARRGECSEVAALQKNLTWPGWPGIRMIIRELRVHWRCARAKGQSEG